jgi:hypothetical protein
MAVVSHSVRRTVLGTLALPGHMRKVRGRRSPRRAEYTPPLMRRFILGRTFSHLLALVELGWSISSTSSFL